MAHCRDARKPCGPSASKTKLCVPSHQPHRPDEPDPAARARARRRLCGAGAVGRGAAALRRRRGDGAARASHEPRLLPGHRRAARHATRQSSQMYDRKGFRPGWFWAYGTVLTQFVAAPCVALGLFTRPMALPLFVLLAMSAYDHGKYDGWFWNKIGLRISGDVGGRRAVFPDQRRRRDLARSPAGISSSRRVRRWPTISRRRGTISRWPTASSRIEGIIDAFGHVVDAASDQAGPLPDLALAFARGGRSRRHLRIHARQRAGDAAAQRHPRLRRTRDPRRNLQGAARRQCGGAPSQHGVPAVLQLRRGAAAALSHGRADRREGAVLGFAATNSATPTCWCSSPRKARRSPARSGRTGWC